MRIPSISLLAFLGCVPISASATMAEPGLQLEPLALGSFSQSAEPSEEEEPEEEGPGCTSCYPPPG
jgi:hypothetical protein